MVKNASVVLVVLVVLAVGLATMLLIQHSRHAVSVHAAEATSAGGAVSPEKGKAEGAAAPASRGMAAIGRAATAGKYLFIFFNKSDDEQTRSMRKVFESTMTTMAAKADSVEINATDPSEKEIVDRFKVSRAPMPLVLALAPNGAITAGLPNSFDAKQLMDAFVSPAMEKCLKALQERKLVLLCIQNGATKLNKEAMQGVQDFKADARFAQATEVVTLNPTDDAEGKFLSQLQVSPKPEEATTVFLAPPAVVIFKTSGATAKENLVAALQAAMSSCGSGGCGSGGCR